MEKPSRGGGVPLITIGPKSKVYDSIGGVCFAMASSSPHRPSAATAGAWATWVDTVSLGNVAWSTSNTRNPCRASSIAVGAPAHRAPTMIAS